MLPFHLRELNENLEFPDPGTATREGIVALGGDLRMERLLLAYSSGIFPWFNEEEMKLWWSPDPRFVLLPQHFKIPASLQQVIKRRKFTLTFDTAFQEVVDHCAGTPRNCGEGTWITPGMKDAFGQLHLSGYAHSVESWFEGKLAGGLFGVAMGKAFFGESMFYLMNDASKVALHALVEKVKKLNIHFIDAQIHTDHLARLGAREIPRDNYLQLLKLALHSKEKYPQSPW